LIVTLQSSGNCKSEAKEERTKVCERKHQRARAKRERKRTTHEQTFSASCKLHSDFLVNIFVEIQDCGFGRFLVVRHEAEEMKRRKRKRERRKGK
jgi:hypothetical protein